MRSELALFLKFLRKRVDPDAHHLGPHPRLPSRVGKRVTQEELAEAIGVCREWYAVLESAETIRTSTGLLDRLADVLMATPEERARLFRLAVPEISRVQHTRESIFQAFGGLRSGVKRLWSASKVEEALEIAAEELGTHFPCADLIASFHRADDGRWKYLLVVDRGLGNRNANLYTDLASSLTCERFDEIVLYPLLSEPGEIGSRDTYRATSVRSVYEEGLVKHKLTQWTFLHGRIRSRRGIVAGITVKHADQRHYSDVDRAVVGAITSMVSLALP